MSRKVFNKYNTQTIKEDLAIPSRITTRSVESLGINEDFINELPNTLIDSRDSLSEVNHPSNQRKSSVVGRNPPISPLPNAIKQGIKQQENIVSESPETVSPEGVSSKNVQSDNVSSLPTGENLNASQTESDILPPEKDYIPFIISIPSGSADPNIFDLDPNIKFSTNLDYPLFSLGFHHYIHSNKNKMEILKEFEGKKKVYLVINKFERYIDNYPDDIGHFSEKFFKIGSYGNGKPNILSRGFYKLWEIIHMFDIIDTNKAGFISAHLAEGPGSFIQATMFFRDKYSDKSKNDKYYAVTLHPEDEGTHVPQLEKSFIEFYKKEKPQRFILHKTYPRQIARGSKNKDNGDITDPKTINLFGGQLGNDRADFVTADGGFDWNNENTQEQEAFRLIFAQIFAALKIQAKDGNFVCKFFETFSDTSIKFIYILTQMYDSVYLVKPLTSRPSNSEKYCVCLRFKYEDTDVLYKNIIKKLEYILNSLHKNPNEKLIEIWPSLKVPDNFRHAMIYSNIYIANRQVKSINEIVEFIKAQNYYGDVYQMRRQMQIDASKYWISLFMPPIDKFEDKLIEIRQMATVIIDKNSNPEIFPKIKNE